MKLLLAFALVVAVGGALYYWTESPPVKRETAQAGPAPASPSAHAPAGYAIAPSTVPDAAPLTQDGRASVESAATEDDTASDAASSTPRLNDVAADLESAMAEIARLKRALDECQYPEATPFGAFVRSEEGQRFTNETDRQTIAKWLARFPVQLTPGEATWLIERARSKDWKSYADTADVAVIQFLGPARLMRELPQDVAAALREEYADENVFR